MQMSCDHDWHILDDCWLVKCSKCLEVRKHPTDVDDCSGHEYELVEDGSYVYRCRKCSKLSGTP